MTEDEAKTKTCCGPQLLTIILALGKTDGRVELTDNPGRCVASACMAWRERKAAVERVTTGLGQMPVEPFSRYQSEGWRQVERERDEDGLVYERTVSPAAGYCGLAGAPQ